VRTYDVRYIAAEPIEPLKMMRLD